MQFPGKITKEDLSEARNLASPKRYWPCASPLLSVLLTMLVAGTANLTLDSIRGWERGTQTNWWDPGVACAGLAVSIYLLVLAASKAARRRFAGILADLPDRIDLGEEGVGFVGPGAAAYLRRWRDFKGWLEGQRVILLEWAEGGVPVILPLVGLSDGARREVRQFLRAHIPALAAGSQAPELGIGPDRME